MDLTTLLTPEDLARQLKCSREHVYRLVREDGCPAFRVGRLLRFDASEVRDWLASRASTQRRQHECKAG